MSNRIAKRILGGLMLTIVAFSGAGVGAGTGAALAAGGGDAAMHETARQHWSWGGMFGRFDKAQLQRGFQVYKEVCSACHGLKRVYFRNLAEPGGPGFPIERVKALAKTYEVDDGPNDEGDMFKRPGLLSDTIVPPFPNDNAARSANGGALPPDLSLITRARDVHTDVPFYMVPWNFLRNVLTGYQEGGADYTYALLVQYHETPPKGVTVAEGMYYNATFPGNQIAMPPPLSKEDPFKYQDGSGTIEKNAADVTAFLAWAANPELEQRKKMGLMVMIYMLIMTILLYLAKRRIWAKVEH